VEALCPVWPVWPERCKVQGSGNWLL